jgi:hypothetical protein
MLASLCPEGEGDRSGRDGLTFVRFMHLQETARLSQKSKCLAEGHAQEIRDVCIGKPVSRVLHRSTVRLHTIKRLTFAIFKLQRLIHNLHAQKVSQKPIKTPAFRRSAFAQARLCHPRIRPSTAGSFFD